MKKPLYTPIAIAICAIAAFIGVGMADGAHQLPKVEPEVEYLIMTTDEVETYFTKEHEIIQATLAGVEEEKSSPEWLRDIPLSEDLQEFLYEQTQLYDLDYDIVLGLIYTESTFRTDIISRTNDYGLMQINKSNQKWANELAGRKLNLLDAKDNIVAGTLILNYYRNSWLGQVPEEKLWQYALNSYNMGIGGYKKAGCPSRSYDRKIIAKAYEIKNTMPQ